MNQTQTTIPNRRSDMASQQYTNERIQASAGTGKTYHLSNRYLRLILDGVPVEEILATTFTRQAAREILDRILLRLACAAESDAEVAKLAEAVQRPGLSRDMCLQKLCYLTRRLAQLRVSTLDAFFVRLAQSFSLELGLQAGWRVLDDPEGYAIQNSAIERYLKAEPPKRFMELMHLLAKGEHKRQVTKLIADTVRDLHSLYLDSTENAWDLPIRATPLDNESFTVALQELEDSIDHPDHSKLRKAIESDLKRLKEQNWAKFLKSGIAKKVANGEFNYRRQEIPCDLERLYRPLVDHAIAMVRIEVVRQTKSTFDLLDGYDPHFQAIKAERRCLQFDDVSRLLLPFVGTSELNKIAFRMNGQINHLLLDEFQDTSLNQWKVLQPFAQRVAQDKTRSFFCVGDVKQAIYRWRGGNADILNRLDEQLPDLKSVELRESYRSSPVVIDFVNRVNLNFTKHAKFDSEKAVEDWVKAFPTHETMRNELPGYVLISTADQEDNTPPKEAVLDRCADQVAELAQKSSHVSIAVLTRTNEAVGKMIFRLQQRGVGASELGGNPLTDSAAVQMVLSRLRLADHPGNSIAFFHLKRSPWAAIWRDQLPQATAARLAERTRQDLAQYGYGETIQQWAMELRPFCDAREWRRMRQLVKMAFVFQKKCDSPQQFAFTFQNRVRSRTQEFIRQVEMERVADPSTDQVSVMTVHQSKGLQFDAVFVVELDNNLTGRTPKCIEHRKSPFEPIDLVTRYISQERLPHFPRKIKQTHEQFRDSSIRESLCVLYVALTRAVHSLCLVFPPGNVGQSAAGLVQSALEIAPPNPPNSIIYVQGDPNWFDFVSQADAEQPMVVTEPTEKRKRRPVPLAHDDDAFVPQGLSPSEREGGGLVRVTEQLDVQSEGAMLFGTVLHAWLEQIQWLEDFDLNRQIDIMIRIAERMGMPNRQIDSARDQFTQLIESPSARHLLDHQGFVRHFTGRLGEFQSAEVRNEQPMSAVIDGQLATGFIDRLIIAQNEQHLPVGAVVVDYKTDVVATETERNARTAYYRPQIHTYRQAVSQMLKLPLESVAAFLVFTHGQAVVEVT